MDIFKRPRQYDPMTLATIAIVGATVGAGASVYGGISAQKSANAEANLQKQQGDILLAESKTNAANETYNQTQAVGKQRLAFLANGVSLEGSPSMVLKDSTAYGQQQVDAILKQGQANYSLAYQSAAITKNKGRAALIAGLAGGVTDITSGVSNASKAGVFDPAKPKTEGVLG